MDEIRQTSLLASRSWIRQNSALRRVRALNSGESSYEPLLHGTAFRPTFSLDSPVGSRQRRTATRSGPWSAADAVRWSILIDPGRLHGLLTHGRSPLTVVEVSTRRVFL